MVYRIVLAACSVLLLGGPTAAWAQAPVHKIVVDSPAMKTGEMMAKEFTPDGRNVSPPITWSNLPPGTRQIAVVCEDFDAGNPPPWVHWIIYKIPPTATGLPANLPIDPSAPMPAPLAGAVHGYNGWRRPMYRGPAPPAGKPHLYHFVVYALDAALDLPPRLTRGELHDAMKGHIIGQGEIVPVYERKPIPAAGGE